MPAELVSCTAILTGVRKVPHTFCMCLVPTAMSDGVSRQAKKLCLSQGAFMTLILARKRSRSISLQVENGACGREMSLTGDLALALRYVKLCLASTEVT